MGKARNRNQVVAVVAAMALLVGVCLVAGCGGGATSTPPRSGSVTGQVLNAQDPSTVLIQLDGQQVDVALDSEGNFAIPNVPPGEHIISIVDPTTNSGAHLGVNVGSGEASDVGDVTLAFGGLIAGIVSQVTDSGALQPMGNVQVVAESVENVIVGTKPRQEPPPPPSGVRLVAFSAEDGSYTMRAVPTGEYQVSVVVPGFEAAIQWVWVDVGRTTPCDFILRPSFEPGVGTVQGTVTAADSTGGAGAPIVGALVSIYSQSPYQPVVPPETVAEAARMGRQGMIVPPYFEWTVFATLTDNQGHYSLNVPAGYQTVEVYAEGYEWTSQPVEVQANETVTVDFALQPWSEPPPVPGGSGGGTG